MVFCIREGQEMVYMLIMENCDWYFGLERCKQRCAPRVMENGDWYFALGLFKKRFMCWSIENLAIGILHWVDATNC